MTLMLIPFYVYPHTKRRHINEYNHIEREKEEEEEKESGECRLAVETFRSDKFFSSLIIWAREMLGQNITDFLLSMSMILNFYFFIGGLSMKGKQMRKMHTMRYVNSENV